MSQPKNILNVDGTIFEFPKHWRVSIFDEWEQFKRPASELHLKGCDIVAFDGETLWLIEVKDYTYLDASIPKDLTQIVGRKRPEQWRCCMLLNAGKPRATRLNLPGHAPRQHESTSFFISRLKTADGKNTFPLFSLPSRTS